jgi:hypothetical protein
MGRGGIEPPTLGLRVPPSVRKRAAADGNLLQTGVFQIATNCHELRPMEASLFTRCSRIGSNLSALNEATAAGMSWPLIRAPECAGRRWHLPPLSRRLV